MKEELRRLREAQAEYDRAVADYATVVAPYKERIEVLDLQINALNSQIGEIEKAMMDAPEVIAATDKRDATFEVSHNEAWMAATTAAMAYYDEHGFPDGKETYDVEGYRVSVAEISNIVPATKGGFELQPEKIVCLTDLSRCHRRVALIVHRETAKAEEMRRKIVYDYYEQRSENDERQE